MDWADYMLPAAINAVLMALKNPEKKPQIRSAMLKIYKTIQLAYAGDPEFK